MKVKQALAAFALLAWGHGVMALSPEEKGLQIAKEWKKRDAGWVDYTAKAKMTLRNKHGQESERDFLYSTMEVTEQGKKVDGDKILVVFDSPKDVKGTVLLTYSHFDRDDDQWLYLPSIKRTKRIASHNKSGSFLGSEIAYEDITFPEVERFNYRWVRDETYRDMPCAVVDRMSVDPENTAYLYLRTWFDYDHYRLVKIDFYDRKNSLLKTQEFSDFNEYLGNYWRAHKETFVNYQTGKSTQLDWYDYNFHVGLNENQFRKGSLESLR